MIYVKFLFFFFNLSEHVYLSTKRHKTPLRWIARRPGRAIQMRQSVKEPTKRGFSGHVLCDLLVSPKQLIVIKMKEEKNWNK